MCHRQGAGGEDGGVRSCVISKEVVVVGRMVVCGIVSGGVGIVSGEVLETVGGEVLGAVLETGTSIVRIWRR